MLRIVATPTGTVVRSEGEFGLLWETLVTKVRAMGAVVGRAGEKEGAKGGGMKVGISGGR
jgi:hypothetical protein